MSIKCHGCGQSWERDPAIEVPCPTCRAPIGSWCKRPSEHKAMKIHVDRDRLAMKEVEGYGKCPAGLPSLADQAVKENANDPNPSRV